jgi:hypothetical protein
MSKSRDIADSAATINYIDGLTSDAQGQLDDKATLDGSPTFTGTVTATSFSGDGSALTGVDSLPSQTGNNGKFLTTDGSAASWDAVDVSSEITGTLPVANGGTGAATLTANNVLLGNGTSAPLAVAPSTSGNVLTSNGTTWQSVAPAGGGMDLISVTNVTGNPSTILINSGINSNYDNYKIIARLVTTTTQAATWIRFEIGGSIITTSTYRYGAYSTLSSQPYFGTVQTTGGSYEINLYDVNSSFNKRSKIVEAGLTGSDIRQQDDVIVNTNTGALTGLQLGLTNDSWGSCQLYLYGYKKS